MTSKATPGPWTFKHSSGAGLGIWADASKALGERYSKDCTIYHIAQDAPQVQIAYELWTQFPRTEWDEMQQANGRLMAAAPELLDTISKRVDNAEQRAFEDWLVRNRPSGDVEQVQDQWEHSSDFSDFCDEWEAERAAIAKATGEPQ